jgi:hypothetical protein
VREEGRGAASESAAHERGEAAAALECRANAKRSRLLAESADTLVGDEKRVTWIAGEHRITSGSRTTA